MVLFAAAFPAIAVSPADLVKSIAVGINLGNTLDAPVEGQWAKEAQEYYFDDYVTAGFSAVRVPVRWDKHTGLRAPYTIDNTFLDRVETVVKWSTRRNLVTIVNCHHEDWLDGASDDAVFNATLPRLVAIWSQVASRFAAYNESTLAFEVYNEPHYNMTTVWLNQMNAAVLPAIRATNPTRNVLFGGLKFMNPTWIATNPDALSFPSGDGHVFLEVHSYQPFDFCRCRGTPGSK